MLVTQYPGDSDADYCESVGTVAARLNMLPSRKSKPKRKARALVVDSDGEPDELDSRPVRKSKPPPILFSAFRPPRLGVVFLASEAEEEIDVAGD